MTSICNSDNYVTRIATAITQCYYPALLKAREPWGRGSDRRGNPESAPPTPGSSPPEEGKDSDFEKLLHLAARAQVRLAIREEGVDEVCAVLVRVERDWAVTTGEGLTKVELAGFWKSETERFDRQHLLTLALPFIDACPILFHWSFILHIQTTSVNLWKKEILEETF